LCLYFMFCFPLHFFSIFVLFLFFSCVLIFIPFICVYIILLIFICPFHFSSCHLFLMFCISSCVFS
jgi:hypothetical protein